MAHIYLKKASLMKESSFFFLHNQQQLRDHYLKQKSLHLKLWTPVSNWWKLWTPSHSCAKLVKAMDPISRISSSFSSSQMPTSPRGVGVEEQSLCWVRAEVDPGWAGLFNIFCKFPHTKTSVCVCYKLTQLQQGFAETHMSPWILVYRLDLTTALGWSLLSPNS